MSDSIDVANGGLPEGWAASTIGEVYDVNPRKVAADALPSDAPVTFVPMPAVDAEDGAITEPDIRAFSAVRKGYTSFIENDVIVAKITPCMENGKAAIARGLTNRHGFGSSEFHVLRPLGAAIPEYVYHFVRQESFRHEAESRMTGSVGQKRVPADFLGQHEFPLPPLAEQYRIVAKVEAVLNLVKNARQRLNRVPEILKQFRQSVLAAACSGRLTADWREGHSKAKWKMSFCQHLLAEANRDGWSPDAGNIDSCISKPDGWAVARLGSLLQELEQGWSPKCENRPSHSNKEWGVIKTSAVQHLYFDERENKALPAHLAPRESLELHAGDLLITRAGPRVRAAVACIVTSVRPRLIVCDKVYRFRVIESLVCPEYVALILNSPEMVLILDKLKTGISDSGVNLTQIKFRSLIVQLPTIDEQLEVVSRVKQLFDLIGALEHRVGSAEKQMERITKATLAKAFAGELVETEADLARRESRDYEPASMLLQRIAGQPSAVSNAVQLARGRAVLDILLLLEAWNQPVSISALEPALVLMRNDVAREVLLGGRGTRRRRRSLSTEPQFVRGLDVIYSGLVANGAIRRVGRSGFELANSQLLAQASAADRSRAAEVLQAIQTLGDLRSLPQVVASITHEQYEITV
jgi:type I restriction enzyme, S subunit